VEFFKAGEKSGGNRAKAKAKFALFQQFIALWSMPQALSAVRAAAQIA